MNAITFYRIGNWMHRKGIPFVPRVIEYLIFFLYNSVVPSSASIGDGTVFAYGGIGVVLHPDSIIGNRCLIGQNVTVGSKEAYVSSGKTLAPRIGDDVYVASGAKVFGSISIGDRCTIAANAVVTRDVESESVVGGVPARQLGKNTGDYRALR
jgi:serine O-acetyltransferase